MSHSIDVKKFVYPQCEDWMARTLAEHESEMMGDMVCIKTIVNVPDRHPNHPFMVLDYFDIPYDRDTIGGNIWRIIDDLRQQVCVQLLMLTNDEYRLDWSRATGHLCLWYRTRSAKANVMADLGFANHHHIKTIAGTEVRLSSIHGFGLFTLMDRKENEQLCDLDGMWMDYDDYFMMASRIGPGIPRLKDFFFMEWNYFNGRVLARPLRTSYGFINHHTEPNIILRNMGTKESPKLVVSALRDIAAGEELLIEYRREELPRGYLQDPSSQYLNECHRTKPSRGLIDEEEARPKPPTFGAGFKFAIE